MFFFWPVRLPRTFGFSSIWSPGFSLASIFSSDYNSPPFLKISNSFVGPSSLGSNHFFSCLIILLLSSGKIIKLFSMHVCLLPSSHLQFVHLSNRSCLWVIGACHVSVLIAGKQTCGAGREQRDLAGPTHLFYKCGNWDPKTGLNKHNCRACIWWKQDQSAGMDWLLLHLMSDWI